MKMIKQFRESEQFIYELLLLRNHSDPMLRSDVIFIVENFLKGILSEGEEFSGFLDKWKACRDGGIMTLEGLYDVLLKVSSILLTTSIVMRCGAVGLQ